MIKSVNIKRTVPMSNKTIFSWDVCTNEFIYSHVYSDKLFK